MAKDHMELKYIIHACRFHKLDFSTIQNSTSSKVMLRELRQMTVWGKKSANYIPGVLISVIYKEKFNSKNNLTQNGKRISL